MNFVELLSKINDSLFETLTKVGIDLNTFLLPTIKVKNI